MALRLFRKGNGPERSESMSGKKRYDEPDRDRGARESPERGEKSPSEGGRSDRDFGGQRRHEDPSRKEQGENLPREPRS